jgi:hypothetical protein
LLGGGRPSADHATAPPLDGRTPCARFLNSEKKYNKDQGRATYRAFGPSYDDEERGIVLSMYRLNGMTEPAIVEMGRTVLGPNGGRLHGRAELPADEIEKLPSDVVAAKKFRARFDKMPVRHVTVSPWDDDKEIRKLHSMDLAKAARLHLIE